MNAVSRYDGKTRLLVVSCGCGCSKNFAISMGGKSVHDLELERTRLRNHPGPCVANLTGYAPAP